MLSKVFYETFSIFEYILIYQLDAYVFRDELSSWCSQRYDFIGAPINSLNKLNIEHLATEMNGGFSLRRTTSFLQAYSGISWYMFVIMTSYKPKPLFRRFLKILIIIIQAFIYKHSLKLVFSHQTNEDLVWSRMPTFKKVQYEKALSFSFERQPSLSFSITKELPFGCHAWGKYEKLSFYSFFIK